MLRKIVFGSIVVTALLLFVAAMYAPTGALAAPFEKGGKTTNRISGVWEGTMSFTDNPDRFEEIVVTINKGCKAGDVCGIVQNLTVACTWELQYQGTADKRWEFIHSRTLSGACPNPGVGYYSLRKDGTLYREHITMLFTAFGPLTRK